MKRTFAEQCFDVFNILFLLFLAVLMLYPLLHVLAISLSDPQAIVKGEVGIWPIGWNFSAYKMVLSLKQIYVGFRNTVFYAALGTLLMLVFTSMAAYVLSTPDFCLKRFVTILFAITMFFSGGLIPTYLLVKNLHMIDTVWAIVLPGCVGAYSVFVFRTFFQGLPYELREAAYMDGAGDLRICFTVIMPLSKALLATYALFSVVDYWNSWFSASIYLRNASMHPLQLFLRKLVIDEDSTALFNNTGNFNVYSNYNFNPRNMRMAAIVVAMLPILCVYPFIQKYFAKGVTIGAVKG